MKKFALIILFVLGTFAMYAQSDMELNRDSVVGWQYIVNQINPKAVYKPIKSEFANGATYTVWQQQASDMLINWIEQSYLPRGLVMRTIAKNDSRWDVDKNGPLQSYGATFLGYEAHFVNGKINLHCCEQGQKLTAGFNEFPGVYVKGFNPGGLYFFAENASFSSGDDDAQLQKEGIDKKIQSAVYPYRTYLDHYHNNGAQFNKIGIVVVKNGEWPFKPVLVKDAIAFIQQQLTDYPSILQKNPYQAPEINKAIEKLKPYYNQVAKLKSNTAFGNLIRDDNGHAILNPSDIINADPPNKTFPEYYILVTTTKQTIDQSKSDNPLWLYFNLTPQTDFIGTTAKFDTKFGTGEQHMVYELLNNFNFDFVAKWLAQPDARKTMIYTAINKPARTTGNNMSSKMVVSSATAAKEKDPNTILYEDFEGYGAGPLSVKNWHSYRNGGHSFENASVCSPDGQSAKWIYIPEKFTFYPDLKKQLPANFTVNYDVYFGKNIPNKRSSFYIRLSTENYIDMNDINRNGFDFLLALSGEAETNKRFMKKGIDEKIQDFHVANLKSGEAAHVSISVQGPAIAVSVNGKQIAIDNSVLPAGVRFTKIGWYCGQKDIYLGNVYIQATATK
ncbi:MAG: hypothetical protein JST71_00555 [Bacteroidetes bacterium]|nr:hypothetical protein [Bacteroidota bacterium]